MESSMVWGGTATGDAAAGNFTAPYSDDEFSDMLAMILTYDRTTQGVIQSAYAGYTGNLAVTNPAGVTIRVATGVALVDGKLYTNSANVDNVVVAPGEGSNFYRIVLRKSFVAQTVRVALIGPDIAAFPAVTQTDGTTWEISLAGIEITSAAVVTVTDERQYVPRSRTRTFLVQPSLGWNTTDSVAVAGDAQSYGFPTLENKDITIYGFFHVPSDFLREMTIDAVLNVAGNGDVYASNIATYGNIGQAQNAHTDEVVIAAHTVTANVLNAEAPITITAADTGDIVRLRFRRDATNIADTLDGLSGTVYVVGWRVSYTAIS